MKNIILLAVVLTWFGTASSQEAKTNSLKISLKNKIDKRIDISTQGPSIYVEGYTGNEIIIEPYYPTILSKPSPPEAAGLSNITEMVHKRVKVAVQLPIKYVTIENAKTFSINLSPTEHKSILIKVPVNIHLRLSSHTVLPDGKISLKNLNGELEIYGTTPQIDVSNVSGPVTLRANGSYSNIVKTTQINWEHSGLTKSKPIFFISSGSADLDFLVSSDLKATFKTYSTNGKLYSDLNLLPVGLPSNGLLTSSLNGGGTLISISTSYGNIYIRKAK